MQFTQTSLRQGLWQGIITGAGALQPLVEARHENAPLPDMKLAHDAAADHWTLSVPIPAEAICDGVTTLILHDVTADTKIGHLTLIAGEPAGDDIRAELDLMRAELDMLKRAFRRHCTETE